MMNISPTEISAELITELYTRNYKWTVQHVCKNSGSEEDAKDLFQESIAVVWMNLREGKFSGNKDQLCAYLRKICTYKWINKLNASHTKKTSYMENMEALDGRKEDEMREAEAFQKKMKETEQLLEAFRYLDTRCREVLSAFYYEKKSLALIAENESITEESAKTVKYRCMMRLRKIFLEKQSSSHA